MTKCKGPRCRKRIDGPINKVFCSSTCRIRATMKGPKRQQYLDLRASASRAYNARIRAIVLKARAAGIT